MILKDCPFCGNKAIMNVISTFSSNSDVGFTFDIKCTKCGVRTPMNGKIAFMLGYEGKLSYLVDERLELAELWNTRKDGKQNADIT